MVLGKVQERRDLRGFKDLLGGCVSVPLEDIWESLEDDVATVKAIKPPSSVSDDFR